MTAVFNVRSFQAFLAAPELLASSVKLEELDRLAPLVSRVLEVSKEDLGLQETLDLRVNKAAQDSKDHSEHLAIRVVWVRQEIAVSLELLVTLDPVVLSVCDLLCGSVT